MDSVGAVLSAANVVLGPAAGAVFPALSEAVPAPIEIPIVPVPVMPLSVTVGVFEVPLSTEILPDADPVVFNVTEPAVRLTVFAPLYVTA